MVLAVDSLGPFDGTGYPVLDSTPHVILSRGQLIYGVITYITKRQKMMVVMTTHRRLQGTIMVKFKAEKYLKAWEKVDPPRKMLAVEGKIINIAGPE